MSTKPDNCEGELNFMDAIEAHVRWKVRLEAYINGTSNEKLDPEQICRDDQCILGKWIYGPGGEKHGDHPKFPGLRETHRSFHLSAGDVVRLVDGGKKGEARDLLCKGAYAKHSNRIKGELARLGLELDSNNG